MNKIIRQTDFPEIIDTLRREKHINPPNQDGYLKWAAIIDFFNKIWCYDVPKIIDIGSNTSILPVILQRNFDVCAVDMEAIHPEVKNKYIGDAFQYLESLPDHSLDFAVDSCAIIHFLTTSEFAPNDGCYRIGKLLKQKLKLGGTFVTVSDTGPKDNGEFITIDSIIECYTLAGLKFNYYYWLESNEPHYIIKYKDMDLRIVRLVFTNE